MGGSSVAVASGGSGRVGIAVNVPLTSVASAFESRVAGEPIAEHAPKPSAKAAAGSRKLLLRTIFIPNHLTGKPEAYATQSFPTITDNPLAECCCELQLSIEQLFLFLLLFFPFLLNCLLGLFFRFSARFVSLPFFAHIDSLLNLNWKDKCPTLLEVGLETLDDCARLPPTLRPTLTVSRFLNCLFHAT
jgi:hypothetical protein